MILCKCCNFATSYDVVEYLLDYQLWENTLFITHCLDIVHCLKFHNSHDILAADSNPVVRFYVVPLTALHISRNVHFANKIMTLMFVLFETQCKLSHPPPHHFVKSWISLEHRTLQSCAYIWCLLSLVTTSCSPEIRAVNGKFISL